MDISYGALSLAVNEKCGDELLVETSVDTTERGGASKVVSLEAEAKGVSVELLDGEAEVSGKVDYRLIYLDRQGRLCGLDYFKDFKSRVKGAEITPTGRAAVKYLIPDAEARISGDEITLSAVVDILLEYDGEIEKPCVTSVEGAETLAVEVVTEKVERRERTIALDKVADVGLGVKKIVLFRVDCMPINVVRDGAGTTASGEVRGTILYMNEADEITELTVSIPFSEGVEGDADDYAAAVKSARVVLTDDEEGNSVEVEATVILTEIIRHDLVQSTIAAACAGRMALEEKAEKVCRAHFVGRKCYEEPLGGSVSLEESGEGVAFVRPGSYAIAGVSVGHGEIKVEGVSAFRIALIAQEGYDAVSAELPFVYVLPFAEAEQGMTAEVEFVVTDAVGSLRGKDLSISAKAHLEVRLYEDRCCSYLTEIVEGTEAEDNGAGISVYFAEQGEDLWSIAKNVGVLPSVLLKANPFLAEPLDESRKVLVFRQK